MKIFTITPFLLLLNIMQAKGFIPEITFLIDDNFYDYTIVVERLSVNDPLFGENFMEVNSSLYDYVTCSEFDFELCYPN